MTLRIVVLSVQALLTSPQPDDPQDAVVANQVRETIALVLLIELCSSSEYSVDAAGIFLIILTSLGSVDDA